MQGKPFNDRNVSVDIGSRNVLFVVHVSDVINTSTANVLFDTPGYPVHSPGMRLQYAHLNKNKLILYHFEAHSGKKVYNSCVFYY